ncbi:RDD family protein [Demequina iriomotensis]|uniref:RDD family protein n=1 Tax=Demequina iriomotensis TaxID=1536641 RepID=UPI00078631EC|nr:RDD family protein [Demequina iriomotensis]
MTLVPTTAGKRLGAYLLDALVVWAMALVPFAIVFAVLANASDVGAATAATVFLWILSLAIPLAYMSSKGTAKGSVGHRKMGLTVVDTATGLPLGRGRAVGRWILLGLIPFAPLSVLSSSGRGWHDQIVGSTVVDVAASVLPGDDAPEPASLAAPVPAPITAVQIDAAAVETAPAAEPEAAPAPSPAPAPVPVAVPIAAAPVAAASVITSVPGFASHAAEPAPVVAHTGVADEDDDLDATRMSAPAATMVNAAVVVWDDGTRVPLEGPVRFGRNPDPEPGVSAVAVADGTRSLSKTHLELVLESGTVTVRDLHSTNGTLVRHASGAEERVAPGIAVRLAPGDEVVMGDRRLRIEGGR